MRSGCSMLLLLSAALLSLPVERTLGQTAPKTHEVEPEKFEVELELSGVFAAEKTEEISVEPKTWSQFRVVEAVPHGARVSEGQVLVRFDDEEINDSIEDMEADQRLAELSIMQAEEELPRLERALNLQHETAERAYRIAEEDLERWNEIDRPLSIKSVEFSLKNSRNNLEYQQEELDQLLQMYEADDLTEETEEIILKRQRNAVESAKFYFELAKTRREEVLEVQIPRLDAAMKTSLEQAELNLAQAKTALAFSTNEKRFSLEKAKHARRRSLERHADLLADRELMKIAAPMDGIVYYGRAVDGKWSGTQSRIESLKPGRSVSPRTVFMTVVQLRPLVVLSKVAEGNVVEIEKGASASVVPAADDETQITAKIADKSTIPVSEGQFSLDLELTEDIPEWIVPGMTCKVKVTTYEKEDALTVPEKAVRTDEEDDEKKYVLVQVEGEDEPQRRDVEVGKTHKGKTEILEGLQAGDEVVLGDAETGEKTSGEDDQESEKQAEEKEEEAKSDSDTDSGAEDEQGDAEEDEAEDDAEREDAEEDDDEEEDPSDTSP